MDLKIALATATSNSVKSVGFPHGELRDLCYLCDDGHMEEEWEQSELRKTRKTQVRRVTFSEEQPSDTHLVSHVCNTGNNWRPVLWSHWWRQVFQAKAEASS